MPVYEYRCDKRHTFEVLQRMSDDPVTNCTVCGAPVQRVFHPVAVHFKGSGFYSTDYGRKAAGGAEAGSRDGDKPAEKGDGESGKPKASSDASSKKADASPAKSGSGNSS